MCTKFHYSTLLTIKGTTDWVISLRGVIIHHRTAYFGHSDRWLSWTDNITLLHLLYIQLLACQLFLDIDVDVHFSRSKMQTPVFAICAQKCTVIVLDCIVFSDLIND